VGGEEEGDGCLGGQGEGVAARQRPSGGAPQGRWRRTQPVGRPPPALVASSPRATYDEKIKVQYAPRAFLNRSPESLDMLPPRRPLPALTALLALAVLMAASGDEEAGGPDSGFPPGFAEPEILDSAGVRVVVNKADTASLPIWRVDTLPRLVLGEDPADPNQQFIQPERSTLLGDGGLVIGDVRTLEIRWFAPDGTHLRTAGGPGEGPAEFRTLRNLLRLPGDSIGVWDGLQRRITVFGPAGDVVRTIPVQGPPADPADTVSGGPATRISRISPAADGGFVSVLESRSPFAVTVSEPTVHHRTTRIGRHAPDGRYLGAIVDAPGGTTVFAPPMEDMRTGVVMMPAGSLRTLVATTPDRIHVAATDAFEVRSYDTDGRLLQRATYPRLERRYTAEEWEHERREALRSPREDLPAGITELLWDPRWRPRIRDPFGQMRTDAAGNIWLRETLRSRRWLVLDPDGVARAVAEVPRYVTLDIGEEYLLGLIRDELDVPHIHLLRILRDDEPPPP
jgi:hypothetical protein